MSDTLAPRAILGVMTPAMNTVVQPELESLRPEGVTNQMQRFRPGGDRIADDLFDEADKLMDAGPKAIAFGLTTDAAPGGVAKLADVSASLEEHLGIPVRNASIATQEGLRALGASRIAVLTPFTPDIDAVVKANIEAGDFEVVAIEGTCAPSLPAICETPIAAIREVVARLGEADCDAVAQIGTALPCVALIEAFEAELGRPFVACNAAAYWQTLRAAGIEDPVPGFGRLLREA